MNLLGALSRISTRERTMLAALVLVGFMIWLSALWRDWEAVGRRYRKAQQELGKQAAWLGDADRFGREMNETLSLIDPGSALDAAALVALVDGMARGDGLSLDLGTPETIGQELFLQHALRIGVKNAPLPKLIEFERGLRAHYPYAALDDFSITANKADPRLLNARLTVISYEPRNAAPTGEPALSDPLNEELP